MIRQSHLGIEWNVKLTLGSDHADPNRLAFTFWILQACLLCLPFRLEGLRQRRELPTYVFE